MMTNDKSTSQSCTVGWKADREQVYTEGGKEKHLESGATKGKRK